MATEPKTGLTFWPPGAMQPDLLFNAMLYWVAAWAQPVVLAIEDDPPGLPADGDAYLVGTGSGAWTGHDNEQARWDAESGIWRFFSPFEGYEVRNLGDGSVYAFDGSDWGVAAGGLADAPSDGSTYGRKDGVWEVVAGGGSAVVDVESPTISSGTLTLDFAGKSKYVGAVTLNANVTTLAFANLPGAGNYAEYELHIAQDGTGSRTFAIPASHKALGGSDTSIASSANAVTVLTASTVDNGTTWRYAMQESA